MEKYFIHDGNKQIGPLTIAELIERGITRCTPVYTSEIGHYVTASEIPLLQDAFSNGSFKNTNAITRLNKSSHSLVKKMAWITGIILILVLGSLYMYRSETDIADSNPVLPATIAIKQEPLSKSALEEKESGNPQQYLKVQGNMHNNFIGQKIIKASITNAASVVGYKDMQMEVVFLSASQAELQSQKFFVNDLVKASQEINFRNVFKAPAATEGFKLKVISATPML